MRATLRTGGVVPVRVAELEFELRNSLPRVLKSTLKPLAPLFRIDEALEKVERGVWQVLGRFLVPEQRPRRFGDVMIAGAPADRPLASHDLARPSWSHVQLLPPAGSKSDLGPAGSKSEPPPAGSKSDLGPAGSKSDLDPAGSKSEPVPAGLKSEAIRSDGPGTSGPRRGGSAALADAILLRRLERAPRSAIATSSRRNVSGWDWRCGLEP